jgi:23S rRNA (pseudouridine1915-N3)-methyltransferase
MRTHIIAVGAAKSGPEYALASHYLKQLKPSPTLVRIADAPTAMASHSRKAKEAEAIRKKIPEHAYVIALDARGKTLSSEAFAACVQSQQQRGCKDIVCLIGGQDGLDAGLVQRADMVLAFGPMIWPHKLAHVMLCEQLFRAQCIMHNHPYHKGH